MIEPPGVMLERDDNFPGEGPIDADLTAIKTAIEEGRHLREVAHG